MQKYQRGNGDLGCGTAGIDSEEAQSESWGQRNSTQMCKGNTWHKR